MGKIIFEMMIIIIVLIIKICLLCCMGIIFSDCFIDEVCFVILRLVGKNIFRKEILLWKWYYLRREYYRGILLFLNSFRNSGFSIRFMRGEMKIFR